LPPLGIGRHHDFGRRPREGVQIARWVAQAVAERGCDDIAHQEMEALLDTAVLEEADEVGRVLNPQQSHESGHDDHLRFAFQRKDKRGMRREAHVHEHLVELGSVGLQPLPMRLIHPPRRDALRYQPRDD